MRRAAVINESSRLRWCNPRLRMAYTNPGWMRCHVKPYCSIHRSAGRP